MVIECFKSRLLLAAFVAFACFTPFANAEAPAPDFVVSEPLPEGKASLLSNVSILEDANSSLSIEQVLGMREAFRPVAPGESLNIGYTKSAFWLKIGLTNKSPVEINRVVQFTSLRLEDARFYFDSHCFAILKRRSIAHTPAVLATLERNTVRIIGEIIIRPTARTL